MCYEIIKLHITDRGILNYLLDYLSSVLQPEQYLQFKYKKQITFVFMFVNLFI